MIKKAKTGLLGLLVSASMLSATATPTTFDSSAFETTLTDGVAAAATVAIAVAGLSAAVMAWRKIRKYFNSAG